MADDFTTKDATGTTVTLATSDNGTAHASKQVSFTTVVTNTLTRPNDSAPYTAGDAITTATSAASGFTFSNCARINGGCGTIIAAQLVCSDPNAALPELELWLFDTAPAIPNDNDAFAVSDAEALKCEAILKFNSSDYSDSSNNRVYEMWNPQRMFKCDSSGKNLYGVLKTKTGFTPVAQSTFTAKLKIVQDC